MAAESRRGCVLQFAKAPVPGRVKTRMVPAYGPGGAAEIARALVRHVAAALDALPSGWEAALCADDPGDTFLQGVAAAHGRRLVAQGQGGLGERMQRACRTALGRGHAAVIVVGSDCLGYDAAYLQSATGALDGGIEAVLGPAQDGGYVLIGLRRCPPGLFEDIAWSTAAVALQQRARLQACGFRWQELPSRRDIDRPADLPRDFDWRD